MGSYNTRLLLLNYFFYFAQPKSLSWKAPTVFIQFLSGSVFVVLLPSGFQASVSKSSSNIWPPLKCTRIHYPREPSTSSVMCRYYRHVWSCGHVRYIFAQHCPYGARFQRPCKNRSVWQSIEMFEECRPCGGGG
jgi:hypothetical protein